MLKSHIKSIALPLLAAAYPILFLYGHNAKLLELENLIFPLGTTLLIAAVGYGLFYLIQRRTITASLSATVLVLGYYLYGPAYRLLVTLDKLAVPHLTLLPVMLVIIGYAAYLIAHVRSNGVANLQKVLLIISAALVGYNLAVTMPVELQKARVDPSFVPAVHASVNPAQPHPDIYFIIFDEYAGFDAIHGYWHDNYVDQFESFLKDKGFFVANGSRSVTLNTGAEIASRLNMQQYAEKTDTNVILQALNNNKVMQTVKSFGYTTVSLDMAFQNIKADVPVKYTAHQVGGMASDEFHQTFLDYTMFTAFNGYFLDRDQLAVKQRSMILYSLDKTADLAEIQGPKFVFTHVLLPHEPFIFDENGNLLPPQDWDNWQFYLGQHKYTTKLAEQLITKLLAQADPNNPPVIVVQSDHGARNLTRKTKDNLVLNTILSNYPTEDMHMILNALYLPGYDTSQLSNDMAPTDTFKLILNFYLNANARDGYSTKK